MVTEYPYPRRFRDIADETLKKRLFEWMQSDLGVSRDHLLVKYKNKFGSWYSWHKKWSWKHFRKVSLFENVCEIHLTSIVLDAENWINIRYMIFTRDWKTHTLLCKYEHKGIHETSYGFDKMYLPNRQELDVKEGDKVIFKGNENLVSGEFTDLNNRFELDT